MSESSRNFGERIPDESMQELPLAPEVSGADIESDPVSAQNVASTRGLDLDREEQARKEREADLESALQECRGKGEYDCLVNLSGGKDSCYLLYRLTREYGLKVLAFTTDMNVPEIAWDNIRRTVVKLNVDHIVYTPPRDFYRKLYRICCRTRKRAVPSGPCATFARRCSKAMRWPSLWRRRIPLVVAGYSPGQPEPDRMVYEFPRSDDRGKRLDASRGAR